MSKPSPTTRKDNIRVFIEGEKDTSDLRHILNQAIYIAINGVSANGACAWVSYGSDPEHIWIEYDASYWESGLPDPFYASRLQVIYHELGR